MIRVLENENLKNRNSFGIQAKSRFWIDFDDPEQLLALLEEKKFNPLPKLFIGAGTNLLFVGNFPGILIHSEDKKLVVLGESKDEISIEVGPGMIWDKLVEWSVIRNLYGIENLSLIPGTVGAAVVQNIGAYGAEFGDRVIEVVVMDINSGEVYTISHDKCLFAYRRSIFKNDENQSILILRVRISLSKIPKIDLSYGNLKESIRKSGDITLSMVREAIISTRQRKLPDPDILGNAGSFFKNPVISIEQFNNIRLSHPDIPSFPSENPECVKIPAAWMIDKAGWKGFRNSKTGVYHKQALVLINHGNSSGGDILKLAIEIQESVISLFGISLEPEVRVIGVE